MTQLLVRSIDPDIAKALKQRATKHNRSIEAEHREILKRVLMKPETLFAQYLMDGYKLDNDNEFFDYMDKIRS